MAKSLAAAFALLFLGMALGSAPFIAKRLVCEAALKSHPEASTLQLMQMSPEEARKNREAFVDLIIDNCI